MKNRVWKRLLSGFLACLMLFSNISILSNAAATENVLQSSSALQITEQPTSVSVVEGAKATVKVVAQGVGLTYKWYFKDASGSKFSMTTSFTGNTYSVTMTEARAGRQVYCVITDASGNTVKSDIATLSISSSSLTITQQPKSVTVAAGNKATVSVVAQGTDLTYKWYFKDVGASKFSLTTSFTGNTYSITMTEARAGRQVYCIITDAHGSSVKSDTVTLNMVQSGVTITKQPKSVTVAEGTKATVKVVAQGEGLTYRWYYKDAGSSKYTLTTSFTGDTYSITMTEARSGRYVYCKVTDIYGNTVKSKTVSLRMQVPVQIVTQPQSVTVAEGEKATVTVQAQGKGLTYQWYFKDAGSASFRLTTSYTGNSYSISMTEARSGRQIYCVITDAYGNSVTSNTVTLSMICPLEIIKQPVSVTAAENQKATVTVEVIGDGLTYEWFYKDPVHTKYYKTTAFTSNSYTVPMTPARNGRQIYCVITDKYGNSVTTDTVTLHMKKTLAITQQPQNVIVPEGADAQIRILADGEDLSFQWQYSDDLGVSWKNVAVTNATYTVEATSDCHGWMLRCLVMDEDGNTMLSEAATILVEGLISVKQQPRSVIAPIGTSSEVSVIAIGDQLRYQWQYSDDNGATWQNSDCTNAIMPIQMTNTLHGRLLRCLITDAKGKTSTTHTARILAEGVLKMMAQPEPVLCQSNDTVAFSVAAAGALLQYTWQCSRDNGASWNDIPGANATRYTTTALTEDHGMMVRCIVTDGNNNRIVSDAVLLLIEPLLGITITEQPQNAISSPGNTAQFQVKADGFTPHYLWQYSTNGFTWIDLDTTDPTLRVEVTTSNLNRIYRCKIWDDYGNYCISDVVSVYNESNLILVQPQDWVGCESGTAYFNVVVLDTVVSCQWQVSTNNGERWTNGSIVDPSYSTTATAEKNGWLYRCVVTDNTGRTQTSDVVSLTLEDTFKITSQPTDLTGNFGQEMTFTIQASGSNVRFTWQRSNDGISWENVTTGYPWLPQTIRTYNVGRYYRCLVTNADGRTLTSNVVQLKWNGTGFFLNEGRKYFVKENGCLASGLEWIGSDLYYFTDSGVMLTGYRVLDNDIYYFTGKGPAAKEFTYVPEVRSILYFEEDGTAATGWTQIDGNTYYFYDTGAMAWGVTQIGDGEYFFDQETGIQSFGMVQIGLNNFMYFPKDANNPYTGLKYVGGKLYYFAEEGRNYGITMGSLQTVGEHTYYFDPVTKQAKTGYITLNGNLYFFGADYRMVKNALVTTDSALYLFGTNGAMRYGLIDFEGKRYYFDPDTGAAVSGWLDLDGSKFYFDPETHVAKTGTVYIDGVKYLFNANGYLRTGVLNADGTISYFTEQGQGQTGFVELNNHIYYIYTDQTAAIGLTTLNGQLYYFDDDGTMQTGFRMINGVRYYFDPDTGAAITGLLQMSNSYTYYFNGASGTGSGLTMIDGDLYCLDDSGIVRYGRIEVDGKIYYFDYQTGKASTGWRSILCSDGKIQKAYFDPKNYCVVTGLQQIDGLLYCFGGTGWVKTGKQTIDNVNYYFCDGTYEAYTGWYENSDGSYSYYDGANGQLLGPGVVEIDGASYYLNAYGRRKTGLLIHDGARMYFDPITAQPVDGFVFIENDTAINGGRVYYFDALKDARYGLQTIDGNQFCFDDTGIMKYGLQIIDGTKYYFDEITGVRKDGLIYVPSNNNYYLFDRTNESGVATSVASYGGVLYVCRSSGTLRTGYCAAATSGLSYAIYLDEQTGEQQLGLIYFTNSSGNSVACYFQKDGCLTSTATVRKELDNALKSDGWHTIQGLTYYVKDGAFCKGVTNIGGKKYYFSELSGAMLTGLRRIGDTRYYFDPESGVMQTGFVTIATERFYFDPETGAQAFGMTTIIGDSYYFMENGTLAGTVQIGKHQYVFQNTGKGQKVEEAEKTPAPIPAANAGQWGTLDGKKCFYNMYGQPVTGLHTIDGGIYYFAQDGKMQQGLLEVNGSHYYFGENGALGGQLEIDGKEYYFHPTSREMLTGMRKIDGVFCYYHSDGTRQSGWITMRTGDRLYVTPNGLQTGLAEIDGHTYYFGENGIMRTGVQRVSGADNRNITCLFDENGIMVKGLVTNELGIYYYDSITGERRTGFATVDHQEYYFDPNTGRAVKGLQNIGGVYCYFDPETAQRQYGLQTVKGRLYCFTRDSNGPGFATGITVVNGKTYYFSDTSGRAFTGYYALDGVKYYFDPTTCASVSGIYRRSDGAAFCFKAGGGVEVGWVDTDGKSYFFYPATGIMAEGLASVGDYLYYFDSDRGLLRNTTVTVGDVTYQLDSDGHGTALGDSDLSKIINVGIANFEKGYGDDSDLENPNNFTCSQLMTHVFRSIGIELPKRACRQYYTLVNGAYDCQIVEDINEAKAGDLIFFMTTNCDHGSNCDFWNEIHHVGIYLGDGKILESYAIEGDSFNNGPMIRDIPKSSGSVIYQLIRINGVNEQ